jgi:hypothetical protein
MKICTRCKIELDDSKFRIRTSTTNGKKYLYLNPTCKICDNIISKEYYNSKKNDPEFKLKNCSRVKKYSKENKDKIIIRQKNKRQKPEYKEYVKLYYQKNRDKILEQHKPIARNCSARARKKLLDWYVKGCIKPSDGNISIKEKKKQILITRLKRTIKKLDNEEN